MDEASRFFDVATGERQVQLELRQVGAEFQMRRQLGYRDPTHGELVVPADTATFRTDLASVPWAFAWLVPGLGTHLPAVLLHDGLVVKRGEGKTHLGADVDRLEADAILRDAMGSLGTPLIRRWLMWAAVSLATCVAEWWKHPWRAVVAAGTVATIVVLGVLATLDVCDVVDVLPWMADRPWWAELLGGALFALVVPAALAVLWRGLWPAGLIVGVALAFLLHVTLAVVLVFAVYRLAEAVVSRSEGGGDAMENLEQRVPSSPVVPDDRPGRER